MEDKIEKVTIMMFKAQRDSPRFKKGQKIFIVHHFGNHIKVRFRYRGNGRYVNGEIEAYNMSGGNHSIIGENGIKEIVVDSAFAERHKLKTIQQ